MSTSHCSTRRASEALRPPAARRTPPVLAVAGVGGLHVHLSAAALRAARVGVLRPYLRRPRRAGLARRPALVRLRDGRVRRACDLARHPPGTGLAEAASFDAASA